MRMTPRIYRLRRTAAVAGGHVLIAEVDVYGYSDTFVLIAAREGRVHHWRNIESMAISDKKIRPRYQYMGEVSAYEAHNPQFPAVPVKHY